MKKTNDKNLDILNDLKKISNEENKKTETTDRILIIFISLIGLIAIIIALSIILKPKPQIDDNQIPLIEDDRNESGENVVEKDIEIITTSTPSAKLDRTFGKVEIKWVDKGNKVINAPLKPALGDLKPVVYNSDSKQFEETDENDKSWYDYSKSLWANAIDSEGNYFVWIPRYAYRIVYYEDAAFSSEIGYSNAYGICKKDQNASDSKTLSLGIIKKAEEGIVSVGKEHFILHPAFMDDSENKFVNGGWDKEISGIWVAKYESAIEENGKNTEFNDGKYANPFTVEDGGVKIYGKDKLKIVSQPSKIPWRFILPGFAYTYSFDFNRDLESHLIKNSEWGCVAYLSSSVYGQTDSEIEQNETTYCGGDDNEKNIYSSNKRQSTTGNATGIYDMNGGLREHVAAYINNGSKNLEIHGGLGSNMLCYGEESTKYKTIYKHSKNDQGDSTKEGQLATENYDLISSLLGISLYETSTAGTAAKGWNNSQSKYMYSNYSFLSRGGDKDSNHSSIFSFEAEDGDVRDNYGFRMVLVTS